MLSFPCDVSFKWNIKSIIIKQYQYQAKLKNTSSSGELKQEELCVDLRKW